MRGFGTHMELPAAIYMAGVQLGVLDAYLETLYYVLPKGCEDYGRNYVRCRRWLAEEDLYIPGSARIWNNWEKDKTVVPADEVARLVYFARGMTIDKTISVMHAAVEPSTIDLAGRIVYHYADRLNQSVMKERNWNLSLSEFVLGSSGEDEYQLLKPGLPLLNLAEWGLVRGFTQMDRKLSPNR